MTDDATQELLQMLTYKRPAKSKAERRFITRFIKPLGVEQDARGNLIKRIGTAPVLWSSHTDTVHNTGGSQQIVFHNGIATAPRSDCLGADDTVGVWLMVQMIKRNVPGLYIFHREEEIGGGGSEFIAYEAQHLLDGIDYCIALDRKGTGSVITHQWYGRCCSEGFATALGDALGLGMAPDDGGTFTDSANYQGIIPECTNISVGYYDQHSSRERLDVEFAGRLLSALCILDISKLPVLRDVSDMSGWNDPYSPDDYFTGYKGGSDTYVDWVSEDVNRYAGLDNYEALRDVVRYHPDAVADYLDGFGITAHDILHAQGYDDEERGRAA